MQIKQININDYNKVYQLLGADKIGSKIMAKKSKIYFFYIKDLKTPAINILKQDCLSIGAELVAPSGVITCKKEYFDVILIVNQKQLEILVTKEAIQPFGLKQVSQELKKFLSTQKFQPKIMGIINANNDSFYDKSRFMGDDAIERIYQMIEEGADIIDIGAVSSRPGSKIVSQEEEFSKIQPICDIIKKEKLFKKVVFSIDSYTPKVVEYALNSGFKIINDITGLANDEIAKIGAKYQATIVIMHMQGTPQTMQINPQYDDVILQIDKFFQDRIKKAINYGIENIILDVGIGFGKTLSHNLALIKHLNHFSYFGYELLIGASRKSMIDKIYPSDIKERLAGSLVLHLKALDYGASIIRTHDVKEHKQAIMVYETLKNFVI
jgi:dihydropteroate synthase